MDRRLERVATLVGELAVEEAGLASGHPVVLWPSLYCDAMVFADQVAALADTHRLLILDPPGHAGSGLPPARFSLEDTAQATFQVLDAFGINRAALVGGAWGGMVGVQMAVLRPDRLSALVLINSPLDRWRGWQRVQMTALLALIRVGGPHAVAGTLARGMVSPKTRRDHPELVRPLRERFASMNHTGMFRSARAAMLDRPSLVPVLSALAVPTLVLTGSDDAFVPVERAREQAALIPGSRFEVIDGTAHLSAYEAPAPVNELVVAFLAEHVRAEP